eukprot:964312-Pelagomonas_calceolata.AAC.4
MVPGQEHGRPLAALCLHALAWIPCYLQAGLIIPLAALRVSMLATPTPFHAFCTSDKVLHSNAYSASNKRQQNVGDGTHLHSFLTCSM